MNYELTKHAQKALEERGIQIEGTERTLSAPGCVLSDPEDARVQLYFRCIPELAGRVLRVAVNKTVAPNRVMSVFLDRPMKGKL